jgi:hypothetical protein
MVQAFQIVDQCPEHRADRSQIIIRPAVEIPEIHAKAEGLVPDPVLNSLSLPHHITTRFKKVSILSDKFKLWHSRIVVVLLLQ